MKLAPPVYLVGSGAQGIGLTDDRDCHVYLLDGGLELGIVDAGAGLDVPAIVEQIRNDGFNPGDVKHLLLTHAHGDHAGGAAALREALGEPRVYVHADCADYLRQGDEEALSVDLGKRAGIYPDGYRFAPCPVDVELQDGQSIDVGNLTLETMDTPGHSRGHTSFLMKHEGRTHFFGGDLLFFGGTILLQDIWDCELRPYLQSIKRLRSAGIDLFWPGHRQFSLRDGQRHIDAALRIIDGLLVPPNLSYGW